jgi:uncharacterized damage-inducible protein DinB
MPAFDFKTYVEYNNWANQRLLATAAQLPSDALMTDPSLSHGTAFETLRHMLDVEWSWRLACEGQNPPGLVWDVIPLSDFQSLVQAWEIEGQHLLQYVSLLPDEGFERELTPGWMEKPFKVGHMIIHLVNHATNHRSELGWFFTRCGHSPGDLEFINYLDPAE